MTGESQIELAGTFPVKSELISKVVPEKPSHRKIALVVPAVPLVLPTNTMNRPSGDIARLFISSGEVGGTKAFVLTRSVIPLEMLYRKIFPSRDAVVVGAFELA